MKNTTKKLLAFGLSAAMTLSMSAAAFATDGDFTGDTMTGTADKYYTVSHENVYTDVSAVKLTWSVPVVTYTAVSNRTWNTSTLRWENIAETNITGTDVTFTLANRGSKEVKGTASFTLDSGLTEGLATVAFTGNEVTIPSIVGENHTLLNGETEAETYITSNCTKVITGTVTVDKDKMAALATANDTKAVLGNYTVTISQTTTPATVSVYSEEQSFITITSNNLTITAGDTWSDTITKNAGKTLTYTNSRDGSSHECTLSSETGKWDGDEGSETTRVVLKENGEYEGAMFISGVGDDDILMFNVTDTVPSTVYFVVIK